ncbi:MAG: aminoacetone oxidase family FAD-binding enzyme [bacterium]
MSKIIIIGGGPAGMAAAIFASSNNNDVILLEKNKTPMKKMLITGAGRCNFCNDKFNVSNFNDDNHLTNKIISYKEEYLSFFKNLGIVFNISNGYYYPYSNTSTSIYDALLTHALKNNVKIIYDTNVEKIVFEDNKYLLNDEFECDKVIIATGSKSYPKTGSDGKMLNTLRPFNIKNNEFLPALVQLKSSSKLCKMWPLLRIKGNASLFINDILIDSSCGEIQLTDYGISGICILNLSSCAVKSLREGKNVTIKLNFLNDIDNYDDFMEERTMLLKDYNILEFFQSIVNNRLLVELFSYYKIDYLEQYNLLTDDKKEKIKNILTNLEIKIDGYNDFNNAQVCQGGIDISELDSNFMIKKTKNMFCIGEMNDIHGDCGGYNLSYAFISGMIAGKEAGKND